VSADPASFPRLVAWLRSERPAASDGELAALLDAVPAERRRRLERVLEDVAQGCRPPGPADLAALRELDDLPAQGT
jgi:hypothetical protein